MTDDIIFKFEALKGVGNVELTLKADQRVYTFIGSNGVGKTKCLEALFQYYFYTHELGSQNSLRAPAVAKKYEKSDGASFSLGGEVIYGAGDGTSSVIQHNTHSLPIVFIGAGKRGSIEKNTVGIGLNLPIGTFELRRHAHIQMLANGQAPENFPSSSMNGDVGIWFISRAQSANPYQKKIDNRKVEIDTLLHVLHEIDKKFNANFMQITGDFNVELEVDGVVKKISELSSGFVSLLKILQAIISGYANFTNEVNLTHVRGIVLIDEIENHLHNEWQVKIIPLLKKLFPNTTFFIATHSALVLTQLQEGEAYQLIRDDGLVRSHLIKKPNKKIFADVLENAFGVDLNDLKRKQMLESDQSESRKKLLSLLNDDGN